MHRYRKPRADRLARVADVVPLRRQPFVDPDPHGQFTYGGRLAALRDVSNLLHRPLTRLADDDLAFINALMQGERAMLNAGIMARYALAKDWRSAGFYKTENHRQIGRAVRAGLGAGRLIA